MHDEMALYKQLGKRVRQRRVALGMTQAELAERAEISASFVGHIEGATRVPSSLTMLKLAYALKVTMDYLFSYQAGLSANTPKCVVEDIICRLNELLHTLEENGVSTEK